MYDIVVSRYRKDVSFASRMNGRVMVYDKETPSNPYNVPVNKGHEASVYLKHIVDHYDTLAPYTFFIHDEEYAWHHSGSLVDKFDEAVASKAEYYNVNDLCVNTMHQVIQDLDRRGWRDDFAAWYSEFIEEIAPFSKLDLNEPNRNSAQFLVHRDVIRKVPKSLYERLYQWIITTSMPNAKSSRFMEWTWHLLFSGTLR